MTSKTLYQGKIIDLSLESIYLPNGQHVELEVIHHPGGAAIAAIDNNQQLCLIRHYRHVARNWLWELPAGKIDAGESPLQTAQRELQEEAGITAKHWQCLGAIYSSPGIFDEQIYLYLAQDLTQGDTQHEIDEAIEVHWLPITEVLAMALDNRIRDAKTLIGLYRAVALLKQPI